MSLTENLRTHCHNCAPGDHKRYISMLKTNAADPASLAAFFPLMAKLGKTPAMVQDDRSVMEQVPHLQATIDAARNATPFIDPARKALREFDDATQRMVEERDQQRIPLQHALAGHRTARDRGEQALADLVKLKAQHPELIGDEPVTELPAL